MDLATAYKACARITRREARNFYFAFLSLPKAQRRAVYALYAFCREADDAADAAPEAPNLLSEKPGGSGFLGRQTQDCDHVQEHEIKKAELAKLRERLWKAAKGEPQTLIDRALADAIDRFGVEPQDLDDVITGVEMDLDEVAIETFEELRTYCYHVASAVGLATLPILNDGIPPTDAMRESAIDLGLGMQFANVLRDVAEDLECGRIYLPAEERARFGVTDEVFRARRMTKELRALFVFEYERAKRMLAEGRNLIPTVPRTGRGCLWLLSEMYGRILERIADAEFDVYAGRVSLPTSEKLGLLASTFWRRL